MNTIAKKIAEELGIKEEQVQKTICLMEEGNTIPFIARYRKEATGGLSDEILRQLEERVNYLNNLENRKQEITKIIEGQDKLTEELSLQIEKATTLAEVEDIYRPYKQKKRTRATIAKEQGLENLANIIWEQQEKSPIEEIAKEYIAEEKNVLNSDMAIQGALDILAERIADEPKYRAYIKRSISKQGTIVTKGVKPEEKTAYMMYYDFSELVRTLPSHRILAINRGEKEGFLKVKIEKPEQDILNYIQKDVVKGKTQYTKMLTETILDSFKRLIEPSVDREIRSDLTDKAEEQAIKVFGKNVKQLLLAAPLKGKIVMGFDPAYRTGCKIAIIDETGKVLDTTTVFPTEPQKDIEGAKKELISLIQKNKVDVIAIGNGTASRESEAFVADLIKECNRMVHYVIVSEARCFCLFCFQIGNRRISGY